MSDQIIIYHNPRCSKSRATLAILEEKCNANEFSVVEYLKDTPNAETLKHLVQSLGVDVRDIMRTKEAAYQENNLSEADDAALYAAMQDHPILIERPIVQRGDQVVIGRPPENVLEILD